MFKQQTDIMIDIWQLCYKILKTACIQYFVAQHDPVLYRIIFGPGDTCITPRRLTDGVFHVYLFELGLMGKGMACPNMKYFMYRLPFLHLSTTLGCFCPRTCFMKNGLE